MKNKIEPITPPPKNRLFFLVLQFPLHIQVYTNNLKSWVSSRSRPEFESGAADPEAARKLAEKSFKNQST